MTNSIHKKALKVLKHQKLKSTDIEYIQLKTSKSSFTRNVVQNCAIPCIALVSAWNLFPAFVGQYYLVYTCLVVLFIVIACHSLFSGDFLLHMFIVALVSLLSGGIFAIFEVSLHEGYQSNGAEVDVMLGTIAGLVANLIAFPIVFDDE